MFCSIACAPFYGNPASDASHALQLMKVCPDISLGGQRVVFQLLPSLDRSSYKRVLALFPVMWVLVSDEECL